MGGVHECTLVYMPCACLPAHQASLKVMFETASVAAEEASEAPDGRTSHGKTVDMQQFIEVVRSINSNRCGGVRRGKRATFACCTRGTETGG